MEGQRRPTALGLTRQVSLVHSSNLRNILAAQEEERKDNKEEKGPKVTLAAILANEKRIPSSSSSGAATVAIASRTLLDIIREEDPNAPVNWKNFKERLRKRSSESIVLPEGIICDANSCCTRVSTQPTTTNELGDRSTDVGPTVEPQQSTPEGEQAAAPPPPVRMSLMALLEQTSETDEAAEVATDAPYEEEEGEEEEMMHTCCVCMVRHKGAAFIPCGHTFCRLCSRELWVSRRNCPLCNGFILEILDIF